VTGGASYSAMGLARDHCEGSRERFSQPLPGLAQEAGHWQVQGELCMDLRSRLARAEERTMTTFFGLLATTLPNPTLGYSFGPW
jgi:hypothetical protein